MEGSLELKTPTEWVSEVDKIPNSDAFKKLSTILKAIEMSGKWMDATKRMAGTHEGSEERNRQEKAYSDLSEMPAQLLQKGIGKSLTNEQRLSLVEGINLLSRAGTGTSAEGELNAVYYLAKDARGKGAEKIAGAALPFEISHFTVSGSGNNNSIRKMAQNYIDVVFRPEAIALVPKDVLEGARKTLADDIKFIEKRKAYFISAKMDVDARDCDAKIKSRQGYIKTIDAEVSRRAAQPAPEKQKM